MALDPIGDFCVDGLGEQLLRSLAEDFAEDILPLGNWHNRQVDGRTIHGGVLLCPRWALAEQVTPRVRRLFSIAYPQDLVIPPRWTRRTRYGPQAITGRT